MQLRSGRAVLNGTRPGTTAGDQAGRRGPEDPGSAAVR